jgi:hypothetical protein
MAYAFFSRNDSDRRWQDPGTLVCCLIAQLARPGPARPGHPVPLFGLEAVNDRGPGLELILACYCDEQS